MRVGDIYWVVEDEDGELYEEPVIVKIAQVDSNQCLVKGNDRGCGTYTVDKSKCFPSPGKAVEYLIGYWGEKEEEQEDLCNELAEKLNQEEANLRGVKRTISELEDYHNNLNEVDNKDVLHPLLHLRRKETWTEEDYNEVVRLMEMIEDETFTFTTECLEQEGCAGLIDELEEYMRDYNKIDSILKDEAKRTLDKVVEDDYAQLLDVGTRLVRLFHLEAADKYKGQAWRTKYINRRFAESPEWNDFVGLAAKNPKMTDGRYNNDYRRKLESMIEYKANKAI